mmetsp:Transcript_62182/g.116347  ORF Transcript_62182/g.116347 Transcript_62182/m.116347 type:complete len:150 (-) Transcript_62182:71-520(-)
MVALPKWLCWVGLLCAPALGDKASPYSVTIAPGIDISGHPVNTLVNMTKEDPFDPFSPFKSMNAFGKHVKNAFKCPFATCTEDVVDEDSESASGWWSGPFFLVMILAFCVLMSLLTPFSPFQLCVRRQTEDEEDEDEDEDEEHAMVKIW